MIEKDEYARILENALDTYNKKITGGNDTQQVGYAFLEKDVEIVTEQIRKCIIDFKATTDFHFSKYIKNNKELLCTALTSYVQDLTSTKDAFLKRLGVSIETRDMDDEIKMAQDLKGKICNSLF